MKAVLVSVLFLVYYKRQRIKKQLTHTESRPEEMKELLKKQ